MIPWKCYIDFRGDSKSTSFSNGGREFGKNVTKCDKGEGVIQNK
jgi:hypothetical protein